MDEPTSSNPWLKESLSMALAALAVVVRASLAEQPRSWRVVTLDAICTVGLFYAAFRLLTHLPAEWGGALSAEVAQVLALLIAVYGWAGVMRFAWSRWGGGAPQSK